MDKNFYIKKIDFGKNTLNNFTKIIDVRSEKEFIDDSIPTSLNLPVLDNKERAIVGNLYAKNIFESRKLGAQIISKNISKFLKKTNFKKSDKILLYCWRGGMRSLSMYLVMKSIGYDVQILNQGYKTFRAFIRDFFENHVNNFCFNILGGLTGSGKTYFLNLLSKKYNVLNLEKISKHKGSVLGDIPNEKQPTQKKFETNIWFEIQKFDVNQKIWVESESNKIGKLSIPNKIFSNMLNGKILNLDICLKDRAKFITKDYKYFIKNPKPVFEKLKILKKFVTNKNFIMLEKNLKTKNFLSFTENLLKYHYDKVYKKRKFFTDEMITFNLKLSGISKKNLDNIVEAIETNFL